MESVYSRSSAGFQAEVSVEIPKESEKTSFSLSLDLVVWVSARSYPARN